MSRSLRNVAFALDPPSDSWSLKGAVEVGLWPRLEAHPGISVRELLRRYSDAGAALRELAAADSDKWRHMDVPTVVEELRARLRDPAILRQTPTDLCGPFSILFELARRDRVQYVELAGDMLTKGRIKLPHGEAIEAQEDLRAKPMPPKSEFEPPNIPIDLWEDWAVGQVDWILAATMREEENVMQDIDDAEGVEGMTFPGAMEQWVGDVLGLRSRLFECYHEDELEALRIAERAVSEGGVAFMLIDNNLLKDGEDDQDEDAYFKRAYHRRRKPRTGFSEQVHSRNDSWPPNHWVVYMHGIPKTTLRNSTRVGIRLWSWGSEFEVDTNAHDFGEYLYAVVTGTPD